MSLSEEVKRGKHISSRILEINEAEILDALNKFDNVIELVYSCENSNGALEKKLDFAGIDIIVKRSDDLLAGVAFRTNFNPYETLTLRDNGGHEQTQLSKLLNAQREKEPFLQATYYVQLNGVDRETLKIKPDGNILIATATQLFDWISCITPNDWEYLYKKGAGYQFMRIPSESFSGYGENSPLFRYSIKEK